MVLQVKDPVLNFFLFVLRILLHLIEDIGYKQYEFLKTLPEKGLKFVPNSEDNTIVFYLSLMLLPIEVDPIPKKRGYKGNILVTRGTGYVKMVFTALRKVVALYV